MSKVRVAIRCRPSDSMPSDMNIGGNSVSMTISNSTSDFQFDEVLDRRATQDEVFRKCVVPIADKSLEGFNGCVFAYGQTGAGKTHTMTGPIIQTFEDRGVCMRTAGYLFDKLRKMPDSNIVIRMSAIEIYNETLIDLFHKSTYNQSIAENQSNPPKLVIADLSTGVAVPALFLIPVDSEEDAYNLLLETFQNRMEAEHSLNRRSSRSHVIYTFYMTITANGKEVSSPSKSQATNSRRSGAEATDVIQSKLHLVDLAGSERVHKTGSTGIVLKEAAHINKSLSFLEQVVLALTQKQRDHIPYRQSKLTYLLKDSIGGNCNTCLIACIWPHTNYLFESLSTLRFATRMKCIENHPVRNSLFQKDSSNNTKLLLQIQLLKKELILRDMLSSSNISPLGGDAGIQGQMQHGQGGNGSGNRQAQVLVDNVASYTRNEKEQFGGELSKGQRIKTARLVQSLVLSNATDCPVVDNGGPDAGGCVNDSNGVAHEPFPMLQIHSQAQARWLVYLLQQMVLNATDGDAARIQNVLKQTLSKCGMGIVLSSSGAGDGSNMDSNFSESSMIGGGVTTLGIDLEAEEANEQSNLRQYENAIGNNKKYSKQNRILKKTDSSSSSGTSGTSGKPPAAAMVASVKKDPQTPEGDNANTFVRRGNSRARLSSQGASASQSGYGGDNSDSGSRIGSSSGSRNGDGSGVQLSGAGQQQQQFYPDPGENTGSGMSDGMDPTTEYVVDQGGIYSSPSIAGDQSQSGSRRQSRGNGRSGDSGSSSSRQRSQNNSDAQRSSSSSCHNGDELPTISRSGSATKTPSYGGSVNRGNGDLPDISPRRLDSGADNDNDYSGEGGYNIINNQKMGETAPEQQQHLAPAPLVLSFEQYTANDPQGQVLNAYYEDSKKNLKQQKANLKILVASVNKKKYVIDGLTEDLKVARSTDLDGTSLGGEGVDGMAAEEINNLQRQLDQSKQSYKKVFNELAACREVLSEAQATKQQCMHNLINAYSAMSERNNGTGTSAS